LGGKTATSQQNVSIPPAVLAQYQSVVNSSNQVAQTPFQTYSGEFVAPVNAEQSQGIAGTNAAANEAQPGYTAAQNTLGTAQAGTTGINNAATGLAAASSEQVNADPLTGQQINSYMSPYIGDVLNTTDALANQNNSIAQSGALGTAISSGAFGSDRTGIAAANLNQQNELAENATNANILNTGYNTALGTAQQQQGVNLSAGQVNRAALASSGNELASIGQTAYGEGANTASEQGALASGAQTARLQGANAQIAAGTVQQQTQQAQDQALYNQFLQQESYPFQVQSWLASISEGTGALEGSDTTTTQPGGFFSDRRLKHDIKKIGETFDKQKIYSYKMHGDDRTHIGLMAQDVEKKRPRAVGVDPGSGYKMVDYGAATEKAANRGHFYEGGVVPMRRVAKAGGGPSIVDAGDLSAILQAQQGMYAPMSGGASGVYGGVGGSVPRGGSSRVPAPEGAVPHLVTAEGGLRAQPTGAQNLSSTFGLYEKGRGIYNDSHKPVQRTVTTTTPGGIAPSQPVAVDDVDDTQGPPTPTARGGRRGFDDGGGVDFDDLAAAHGAMYGQGSGQKQEDIPNQGGTHTLAVASGTPQPAPSGGSNLNTGLGLVQKGQQIYGKMSGPSAPTATLGDTSGLSQGAMTATAPAADSGTISGIASTAPAADAAATSAAAGAGSGAAADAAGSAAAGAAGAAAADAGGTAAAEAAAAIAAEYAAADVGTVALLAAKRGGRIRRPGYDAGGMPYSSDDGQLDIPDDGSSAPKLQTAGPLVKQPTGLQTLETLGTQQGAQGAISGMFSNQALRRGGVAGRRGYDDGGDVDDTDAGPSTASDAPAASGVAAAPLKMDSGPSWWDRNKGKAIPLLEGLAAMGTAPTKHLGVALAAGLGAGAGAYVPTQQGLASTRETEAEVAGKNIQNQMAQMNLSAYQKALSSATAAPSTPGNNPVKSSPFSMNPVDIAAATRNRYFIPSNYTPQEVQAKEAGNVVSGISKNPAFSQNPQFSHDQRIASLQIANQNDAQDQYDKWYNVATSTKAGDQEYTNAKMVSPGDAAQIAQSVGLDPARENQWTDQDRAKANAAAGQYATSKVGSLFQWTGDKPIDIAGARVNSRTSEPLIGSMAQTLTPMQATDPVTLGAGLPQTRASVFKAQQPKTNVPAANTPVTTNPPQRPVAPTSIPTQAPQTEILNGVDLRAIPKLPPPPAATDQVSLENAKKTNDANREIQNQALVPLRDQVSQAARNTAIYSQLEKTLANANPREFGPSSASYKALANLKTYLSGLPPDGLVNQAEADKYLAQLGVGGSKQLLGADQQLRQQEMMLLMAHANPNIDQPLQVIKNLASFGKAGNTYDLKAANTAIEAIRNGADPIKVPGAIENQAHRADYVNGELSTPQAAKAYLATHPEAAPLFKKKYGYLP
jgi:hypothetical protein